MKYYKDFTRFQWEADSLYEYRYNIHVTAMKTAKLFKDSTKLAEKGKYDYSVIYNEFSIILNEIKEMKVPFEYVESHELLMSGYEYYLKAYKSLLNLDDITKEKANISVQCIEVGNAYIKISSYKDIEMFNNYEVKIKNKEIN